MSLLHVPLLAVAFSFRNPRALHSPAAFWVLCSSARSNASRDFQPWSVGDSHCVPTNGKIASYRGDRKVHG